EPLLALARRAQLGGERLDARDLVPRPLELGGETRLVGERRGALVLGAAGGVERLAEIVLPVRRATLEGRLELLARAVLVRRARLRLGEPGAQPIDLEGELPRLRHV